MRRGGTPIARASRVCDKRIGFRKSSIRISPGCGLCRSSVVVDDFDLVRMSSSPDEANPPLVIDADRMLSASVFAQRFEPVARRHTKVIECPRIVDQTKLSQRHCLDIGRKLAAAPPFPNRRSLRIAKAGYHPGRTITQNVMRYKDELRSGLKTQFDSNCRGVVHQK